MLKVFVEPMGGGYLFARITAGDGAEHEQAWVTEEQVVEHMAELSLTLGDGTFETVWCFEDADGNLSVSMEAARRLNRAARRRAAQIEDGETIREGLGL